MSLCAAKYSPIDELTSWTANEIPQAANRVVGVLGLGRRAAVRVVGAELLEVRLPLDVTRWHMFCDRGRPA